MERHSERSDEYVSLMTQSLGHADRVEPFRGYCTRLMLPVTRKSVEPMAAHLSPDRVRSEHQRLHHFVADAPWSDQAALDTVRRYALERIKRRAGPPEALIIDARPRRSTGLAHDPLCARGAACQVQYSSAERWRRGQVM
jgi:SRSO17 transposase